MIDYESEIFDGAARAAMAACPGITVTSIDLFAPAEFPAMSMSEMSNSVDTARSDMGNVENAAIVAYDVRTFSNLPLGAKEQAKSIMAAVDAYMESINFTRTFTSQGKHPNNASIYQVSCRYTASVGSDGKIHRRS